MSDVSERSTMRPKTIWTSCFGRANRIPPEVPQFSIARFAPAWWAPADGRRREPRLAPSAELLRACKAGRVQGDWRDVYRAEITERGELAQIYEGLPDGCVLLCWESNWSECHRKQAWEMLHERFGVQGGELSAKGMRGPKTTSRGVDESTKSAEPAG